MACSVSKLTRSHCSLNWTCVKIGCYTQKNWCYTPKKWCYTPKNWCYTPKKIMDITKKCLRICAPQHLKFWLIPICRWVSHELTTRTVSASASWSDAGICQGSQALQTSSSLEKQENVSTFISFLIIHHKSSPIFYAVFWCSHVYWLCVYLPKVRPFRGPQILQARPGSDERLGFYEIINIWVGVW